MKKVQMAYFKERSASGDRMDFAVFDANDVSGDKLEFLERATDEAINSGMHIDQSAIAYTTPGEEPGFVGNIDLVSYLIENDWEPNWTHAITV